MKSAITQFGRAAFVISVMAFGMSTDANAQRKFTFGYDQPHSTAYGIAGDIFDAKLKELSGGKLSIDQFPGAQLGQEPVMLQKLRTGDIDFVITSTANASTVAPQAGVFSLHFLFRDQDHLAKTLADPAVSKAFRAMIDDSVQGAHVLGLLTMGLRNMYSQERDQVKVDDIKGDEGPRPGDADRGYACSRPMARRPYTCRSARSTPRCRPASSTSRRTASTSTWQTSTTKWPRCSR